LTLAGGLTPFTPVTQPGPQLRTLLYTTDQDGNYYMADGVLNTYADNFSNDVDGMDAGKLFNTTENLSIERNGVLLAIERRQMLHTQDTIFLQLSNLNPNGLYRFVFLPAKIVESGLQPYLEDNYLHARTALRLSDSASVNFVTDGSAGSLAPGRFRIVFDAAQGPLPLTFTNARALLSGQNIAVEWSVGNEQGIKNYEIEKSADGIHFSTAAVINAGNNFNATGYNWLDVKPLAGYNYYRIRSVGVNRDKGIVVYPNPPGNGIIRLLFNNQPAGKYTVRLINRSGQVMMSREIHRPANGSSSEAIPLGANLAHGLYRLEIVKPGGGRESINNMY
jgi:hypothetical protein